MSGEGGFFCFLFFRTVGCVVSLVSVEASDFRLCDLFGWPHTAQNI